MLNINELKNYTSEKFSFIYKNLNTELDTTEVTYQQQQQVNKGFLDSSFGKESACNARDSSSIPGLGRSAGEGIGYPLQYSWASLVAQLVKNPPAMWETRVRSLGWQDPLEKGKVAHFSILAWRIPENSKDCIIYGVA